MQSLPDGDVLVVYTDGASEWEKPVDPADRKSLRRRKVKVKAQKTQRADAAGGGSPAEASGGAAGLVGGTRGGDGELVGGGWDAAGLSPIAAVPEAAAATGESVVLDEVPRALPRAVLLGAPRRLSPLLAAAQGELVTSAPPTAEEINEYARWLGTSQGSPLLASRRL
jgi:hypothetical protein